jgi:hypothetical protein
MGLLVVVGVAPGAERGRQAVLGDLATRMVIVASGVCSSRQIVYVPAASAG